MADSPPLLSPARERLATAICKVLELALPNAFRMVFTLGNEVTNMLMLARATSDPAVIAAVGLGNMMQNVLGLSIGLGLISAFDTFISQAYGAGLHDRCLEVFERGRLIVLVQLLWIGPLQYFSEDLLLLIGTAPDVAACAGSYNRAALLGFPGLFWMEAFKSFLSNRSRAAPGTAVAAVTFLLHIVWCYYFVLRCDLGNFGAGLANVVTWNLGFVLLAGYTLYIAPSEGIERRSLLRLTRKAWHGWWEFLAVAIPATIQICGEWWFFEICALIVSYLGKVPLAAHVATLNYIALAFMPSIGISQSASALVGQAVGAKNVQSVRQRIRIIIVLTVLVIAVVSAFTLGLQKVIASQYSQDLSTQSTMLVLIQIYFPFTALFDAVQNVQSAILRGLGRPAVACYVYLFCFYGVMVPSGCILAYPYKFGVEGIWYAMLYGLLLAVLSFGCILWRTQFDKVIAEAERRLCASQDGQPPELPSAPARFTRQRSAEAPSQVVLERQCSAELSACQPSQEPHETALAG